MLLCPLPAADFCCNGTVVEDAELGKVRERGVLAGQAFPFMGPLQTAACMSPLLQVIQLQGDQRKNASEFLIKVGRMVGMHVKGWRTHAAWRPVAPAPMG
jgi:translation initiation factor 1 (eIF-1/SUI1)